MKMRKAAITIYIVVTLVLAASTFAGAFLGTAFIGDHVYSSPPFFVLWAVLSLLMILLLLKNRVVKRLPVFLFHISFVVILLGGVLTFLSGKRGYVYLRQGVEENAFISNDEDELFYLPFTISLDTFLIDYYPGTNAPMNYSSKVSIKGGGMTGQEVISMNNILKVSGYRFYQSSFDADLAGSWLTVNYDPWGTGVTYLGYILLGITMIWLLFSRMEEFISLLRHPLLRKGALVILFLLSAGTVYGRTPEQQQGRIPVLPRVTADSLKSGQVVYNERITPFNTLARDVMIKIYGKPYYKDLTPEQVVESIILYPEEWNDVPIIGIDNRELRTELGIDGKYASMSDLFDHGNYRLEAYWSEAGGQQNKFSRAVSLTDEKVGIIFMLRQGDFIKYISENGEDEPSSDLKIKAELLYNYVPFSKILFIVNLTLGLLAFFAVFYYTLKASRPEPEIIRGIHGTMLLSLLFHSAGQCLRWFVSGRIPLANGYETMQFLAWSIMIIAFILRNRLLIIVPAGFVLSGFALLVSYIGQSDPAITPLMPVLLSPWLSLHVSVIMMSYALFAFILIIGIVAVTLHKNGSNGGEQQIEQLTVMSRLLMYPAIFLLGAGIFIGAVWANVSWGRYWGWDPKEVWALVTFMVYGAAFHNSSVPAFRKPLFFHWYMILAFLTVIMTYFGVNLFDGMHSY